MTKQQQATKKVPPQEGGCWFCYSKDNWPDMRFDTEFDTNAHIGCIREAIEKSAKDEPTEAHIMAYLLTDTDPDNMMYPPWEPPDSSKLPKTGGIQVMHIDGELYACEESDE